MTEHDFALRLSRLRTQKGISARDMSLSMGQNPGYINNIESEKSMPSLSGVFNICDFLGISVSDFFNLDIEYPVETQKIMQDLQHLTLEQLRSIEIIIEGLIK